MGVDLDYIRRAIPDLCDQAAELDEIRIALRDMSQRLRGAARDALSPRSVMLAEADRIDLLLGRVGAENDRPDSFSVRGPSK